MQELIKVKVGMIAVILGIVGAGFGAAGSMYFIRLQPQGVMVGYSTRF